MYESNQQVAMQEWRDKNPGKEPSKSDLAKIMDTANEKTAAQIKAYGGLPIKQEGLNLQISKEARDRADKDLETNFSYWNKEFKRIAKETDVPYGQVKQQWLDKQTRKYEAELGGGKGGGGTKTGEVVTRDWNDIGKGK